MMECKDVQYWILWCSICSWQDYKSEEEILFYNGHDLLINFHNLKDAKLQYTFGPILDNFSTSMTFNIATFCSILKHKQHLCVYFLFYGLFLIKSCASFTEFFFVDFTSGNWKVIESYFAYKALLTKLQSR